MNRRHVLLLPVAAAAAFVSAGHTPYRQWVVYRRKHLLIGCHKADPATYDVAREVVRLLGEHLPAAHARVARAPGAGRLASLLGTGQMDVAVLGARDAVAMLAGSGSFAAYGAVGLRLLAPVADRLLVAHEDFPQRHAWLVASALVWSDLVPAPPRFPDPDIPWHPGSLAFLDGRPEPGGE